MGVYQVVVYVGLVVEMVVDDVCVCFFFVVVCVQLWIDCGDFVFDGLLFLVVIAVFGGVGLKVVYIGVGLFVVDVLFVVGFGEEKFEVDVFGGGGVFG